MFPKPRKHRQCGQSKNCFFSRNPAPFDLHQTSLSSFRQCGQIGHTSSGASTRSSFFCVVINSRERCRLTQKLTHAGATAWDCQPSRDSGVVCSDLVRRQVSHSILLCISAATTGFVLASCSIFVRKLKRISFVPALLA